jgi:hypothetical protein
VTTTAWLTPEQALKRWKSGEDILLPPTWSQIARLARHADTADLLRVIDVDETPIPVVAPVMTRDGDTVHVEFEESEQYYADGPGHPWAR